ncbi:MAG: 16S rRNA processing protein RimM [Chloroflexi bacterium HGW-Chloroflexi-10]|nr:MAG: 16S rRNA processing protein RimM [Chloroflexi bacterium HGW-Chloroflexi-10]
MSNPGTVSSDHEELNTGSLPKSEPVYLSVGRFGKAHGLKGEIILYLLTDFPERLRRGKILFWGEKHNPISIQAVRQHNKGLLLQFSEYNSTEEVEILRNQYLYVNAEDLPALPKGEYYHHQLIGIEVYLNNGEQIGILTEVLETGANDVYVVHKGDGKEELFPAIKEVILSIDLDRKRMVVQPLDYYDRE